MTYNRKDISNKYTIRLSLNANYSNIFDVKDKETIDELLKKLRRDDVIAFCAYINSKFNSPDYDKWEFNFVNQILIKLPKEIGEELISKFNILLEENGSQPHVFNIINSLRLIQYVLSSLSNETKEIYANADLPILKIFLLLNEEITGPANRLIDKSDKFSYKEKFIRAMIPGYIINSELLILKDFRIQSIKFKMFCEYIEQHSKYRILLERFFETFGVADWKDYLKLILVIYTTFHKNIKNEFTTEQVSCKISFDVFDAKIQIFIKNFIVNDRISDFTMSPNSEDSKDYMLLRKYPFYLDDRNTLIILNINFLADHIFQSIYFDFKDIAEKEFGEEHANNFKSIYSFEYSQKVLFNKTVNYCFCDKHFKIKKFNDDRKIKEEYSDGYIRKEKKIFLVEFKDYLLSRELKYSLDYHKIADYLIKRFVEEAGIVQLIKVIGKIETGGFEFDPLNEIEYYKNHEIIIQPIIVYSDMALTFDGLNYFINKLFKEKLRKYNFKLRINDIILIHLDFLISYQDIFHYNKIKLNDLFGGYQEHIRQIQKESPEDAKVNPNEFITFEQYFYLKLKSKNIKPENPKAFQAIAKLITDK